MKNEPDSREFVLVKKISETDNVTTLFFKPTNGKKFDFVPGQYVDAKPPSITGHGKSYTVSSIPSDDFVSLTIKRQGDVSSAIIDMKLGEKIVFKGPYGYFYPEENINNIVFVAGGVGITPFYSVIRDKLSSGFEGNITLLYSNKTKESTTFFDELKKLAKKFPDAFKIIFFLTQSEGADSEINEYKRIDKRTIRKYVPKLNDKCYYVCGSVGFVNDVWRMLKEMGVSEENIYTEAFY